ncbi:alpha/beta-hydrolase [Saccharata proteae CBS 121410]|uniref:Carboxylic ester hydrolase n=1 Tax=Saccharata proteae CBS 121410 TaxID=1314787 RepID=A0A9P4HTL9_9PEZI|nr:alpha/beta-hydrolase [Saccharata proteae CBS 121410]
MKLFCNGLFSLGAVLTSAVVAQDHNDRFVPIADLGYVKYKGTTNTTSGLNLFYGIPFAQPPVGELRWRKPRPIESRNNFSGKTVDATKMAPECYQSEPYSLYVGAPVPFLHGMGTSYWDEGESQSEDCLYLNVKTPKKPVSSSLPVVVQIHGGGYTQGSAQSSPGDALVHESNGKIIYVEIQYRLGFFGFLAGSEVKQNGDLNAGLLDQRAALEWVQRNIKAFGGDPSRVTIWGGSAGGGSVSYQLIAGGAFDQPPFSAAIPEFPWWQPLQSPSVQEHQYYDALHLADCKNLDCLRSKPSSELQFINQRVENNSYPGPGDGFGVFYWGPVVDGKFIRQLPDQEFKQGNFHHVPLMLDREAYEGYIFSNQTITTMAEETMDAENLFPSAGPAFFSRLYKLYPRSSFNSTFFQRQTWFGDFIINCPTYYMATARTDGGPAVNNSAVFKLIFAAGTEEHAATAAFLTSSEIGFPAANNHTLAQIMANYWISFAVKHDPNPLRYESAPFWPSYSSGGKGTVQQGDGVGFDVLRVNYAEIISEKDEDAGPQCDFFSSHGYTVEN